MIKAIANDALLLRNMVLKYNIMKNTQFIGYNAFWGKLAGRIGRNNLCRNMK